MRTIFVVRHGQDLDNANKILNGHRNEPLTSIGREQARLTGIKLLNKDIEIIFASPLNRAHETAFIISELINVDNIISMEDLKERDFGELTGKPLADIPKLTKHVYVGDKINYFLDGPGVETFPKLMIRAKKVLKAIVKQSGDKNTLIVTHGDMSKMLRGAFYNWTWQQALDTPYMDNAEVIELVK
jgi:probable phosphoglycerate mutase